jgi:hypothetical protein
MAAANLSIELEGNNTSRTRIAACIDTNICPTYSLYLELALIASDEPPGVAAITYHKDHFRFGRKSP